MALLALTGCAKDKPKEQQAGDALKRGLAAHVAGDNEKALDLYNDVLEADKDNKFALYNIGLIRQNTGDTAEAEKLYRQVVAIDPNYAPALFNLAVLEFEQGNNEEAIALYRRVIAITPDDANAHLNLGFALKAVGNQKEGNQELATAVKLNPSLKSRIPGAGSSQSPTSVASPSASG